MHQKNILDYIKGQIKTGGMVKNLILANVIVFLFFVLLKVSSVLFNSNHLFDTVVEYFIMPGSFNEILYKPWTVITALFTHTEIGHFFWNMLMLYFTSKMFVQFFGERRLLTTYIFGGVFGGLIHVLSYLIFPYFADKIPASILGASGSVAALIGALVYHQPQLKIKLFFALEIPFWLFGVFFILSDFINLTSDDGVAHFAHIGGVLFGVLSVLKANQSSNFMNRLDKLFDFKFSLKRQPKMKVYKNSEANKMSDDQYKSNKANKQKKMDAILDKISANGYDNLTKSEKDFLFKYSHE